MPRRHLETVEVQRDSVIWTPDQCRLYTAAAEVSSAIISEALDTALQNNGSYASEIRSRDMVHTASWATRLRAELERVRTTYDLGFYFMPLAQEGYGYELVRRHLVDPSGTKHQNIETTRIPDLLLASTPGMSLGYLKGRRLFKPGIAARFPKQLTLPARR